MRVRLFDQVAHKREIYHTIQIAIEMIGWNKLIERDRRDRREETRFGSHHGSNLSCFKTGHADKPEILSPLHFPSEEAGGVLLQAVCCFLSGLAGGSQSET